MIFRQLFSFSLGSAIGLFIDLVGFELLSLLGLRSDLANLISSFTAVIAVYFFVTRFTFSVIREWKSFIPFIVWYLISIPVFSFLVLQLVEAFDFAGIVAKLCIIPISFTANYLFNRFLFSLKYWKKQSSQNIHSKALQLRTNK